MQSQTVFLQPTTNTIPNPHPNFATATGNSIFFNYSHNPSGTLTDTQANTLVRDGVALAIADAQAVFLNDPGFSFLYSDSMGVGEGTYEANSQSQTKVVANFAIAANQTFSLDFFAQLSLTAKEIKNTNAEYNQANSKSTFLILDTTNPDRPKILDYFDMRGNLITSEKRGNLRVSKSCNVTIANQGQITDIGGDNGSDSLDGSVAGTYRRTFSHTTNITIVEINTTAIEIAGDDLIGYLGTDVTYGTIRNDNLYGNSNANKIYGSLGSDRIYGLRGNDILEGGQGRDFLFGGEGNDRLHGGLGNDILTGDSGNDILVGGDGHDQFIFHRRDMLLRNESDIIQDFQVGIDKIVFQGWGSINSEEWLRRASQQGVITNTNDGVIFKFDSSLNQPALLISGVNSSQITADSIMFI